MEELSKARKKTSKIDGKLIKIEIDGRKPAHCCQMREQQLRQRQQANLKSACQKSEIRNLKSACQKVFFKS